HENRGDTSKERGSFFASNRLSRHTLNRRTQKDCCERCCTTVQRGCEHFGIGYRNCLGVNNGRILVLHGARTGAPKGGRGGRMLHTPVQRPPLRAECTAVYMAPY